ncbi:MAG TPA: DNA-binding protein WhiA [Lachnospiraceae bacterium]|nr:DNA-binding protein WhiA [Lachnospiraceae bacterium]
MSFSGEIKEELSRQLSGSRHCRLAELAAILSGCGKIGIDEEDRLSLEVQTENLCLARKYYILLKKTFETEAVVTVHKNAYLQKNEVYSLLTSDHERVGQILRAVEIMDKDGQIREQPEQDQLVLLKRECCKRAYIRGAFLVSGSVSDPKKSYHLELVCQRENRAGVMQGIFEDMGLSARVILRKKAYMVYLKEGEQIREFLACIGANRHLFAMENVRILKEMRNNLNRKVNCETANLGKTVSAAVRQIEDIHYIEERKGLNCLAPGLRQMAELRLSHPDASMKELGELLVPPVGKSGVNHRLRKISEMAKRLRREG